jgi:DNA polymerase IV
MDEHILHIDMNAFFASVEQATHPEYKGKPVIVCGDAEGRGVVSTASYEARRFGVHSAMPTAVARRLCPNGIFLHGDHRLYGTISDAIFEVMRQYTPLVEPASIDEAYMDVMGCDSFGSPVDIAVSIKAEVRRKFDLTCSIGVAVNRLLAKMASEMQKPDGLVVLRKSDLPARVWPLGVRKIHGVGEKTAVRLEDLGIMTIGQLARAPLDLMAEKFGIYGESLVLAALGESESVVGEGQKTKSLSHETTFSRDVDDRVTLNAEFLALSEQVAVRLRRHGLQGKTVGIKYRFPDFDTHTRSITLPNFCDTTEPIYRAARELFDRSVPAGKAIRLIGVSVSGIVESGELRQAVLDLDQKDIRPVHQAIDELRRKFGEDIVVRGTQLVGEHRRPR